MYELKPKRRWMPLVLGLSLALNLAVVAAVAGAAWRHKSGEGDRVRMAEGGAIYVRAVPRERIKAVREDLRGRPRDRARVGTDEMLAVLRAEPFDPAAATLVLEAQRETTLRCQYAATQAWLVQILDMDQTERAAYADRLEQFDETRGARWRARDRPSGD